MVCKNCGNELKDNEKFCASCGCERDFAEQKEPIEVIETAIATETVYPEEQLKPFKKFLTKRNICLSGIISSVVVIVLGIIVMCGAFGNEIISSGEFSSGTTDYTSHITYGGDAYTGMQNASADASNNAAVAAENVVITNGLVYDVVQGINALQNIASGALGMLIFVVGLIGLFYFSLAYIREKETLALEK